MEWCSIGLGKPWTRFFRVPPFLTGELSRYLSPILDRMKWPSIWIRLTHSSSPLSQLFEDWIRKSVISRASLWAGKRLIPSWPNWEDISGGWVSSELDGKSTLTYEPFLQTLRGMHLNTAHSGEIGGYTDHPQLYARYPLKRFQTGIHPQGSAGSMEPVPPKPCLESVTHRKRRLYGFRIFLTTRAPADVGLPGKSGFAESMVLSRLYRPGHWILEGTMTGLTTPRCKPVN